MSIFPPKRAPLRLLLVILVVLTCLAMSRLQLWRAETRGERFAREQTALVSTPIFLSAQQRDLESLIGRAATARASASAGIRRRTPRTRPTS